ncbi:NAD(P)H-dependent oxidoreductase [Ottowia sp. GY511]|uniref:NADPH-dependent FMN reductase n=1 Tax=Ottowia flava TaxID=2675430 RepID=A0ABW4KYL5_9BURK|nr:NADPH-dependent FMN reductase [Ottowia sp. GY511]TXK31182.1 NAD(P)H-dependent oxidoreductase [Ottowia sp. GY511]
MHLLAISGSLRSGSYNTALARTAQQLTPEGATLEVATLHGIPLYDGDVEQQGMPEAVLALKARIAAADGLLLVTPEYNQGVPGVFKNAIDWLSRSDMKTTFGRKPTGLMGASMGGFGTLSSQNAWLPTLKVLGVQLFSARNVLVSRAQNQFDAEHRLQDEATRQMVAAYLSDFAAFVVAEKKAG